MRTPRLLALAATLALPAAGAAQQAVRPFGTLREQAALQQQWLEKRRKAFEPEARRFGISPPKGILLLGVQGAARVSPLRP